MNKKNYDLLNGENCYNVYTWHAILLVRSEPTQVEYPLCAPLALTAKFRLSGFPHTNVIGNLAAGVVKRRSIGC
jgi:hypothetical protein